MHTVLITDDNELIRETLEKALVGEGYRVRLAKDGRECLETARLGDIDLILLDMRLPDINGIDVLQRLRQEQTDSVVLMMTAYGDVESTKRALELGAFDFIRKPVTPRRSPRSSRWPWRSAPCGRRSSTPSTATRNATATTTSSAEASPCRRSSK